MRELSRTEFWGSIHTGRASQKRWRLAFLTFMVTVSLAGTGAYGEVENSPIPPKNNVVARTRAGLLGGSLPSATASFLPNVQVQADPGNLSDEFGPAIAVDASGTIYMVWNVEEGGDEGIYFSRSDDGGATFNPPVRINDNVDYPPSYDAYQPDIALDGNGAVYVVWFDYRAWADDGAYTSPVDIYLDKSTDGGATWSTDVKVSSGSGYYPWHFQPYIAVDQDSGFVYISFTDYNRWYPEGDTGDVFVSRSTDGGASFGAKVKVDDSGDISEQGFSSIATNPISGHIYVAFHDSRSGDKDIYVARSVDDGQTFGANVRANDVTANDQEEPTIRADHAGNVYVVWKDWRDDVTPQDAPYLNDIYIAKSTNGGNSFGPSLRVADEHMNAEYSFNFPPRLAVDNSGFVHVVWHDTRSGTSMCYYDRSQDGGKTFLPDIIIHDNQANVSHSLPRLAEDGSGRVHVAWMDKRNGNNKFDIFSAMAQAYFIVHGHDFDGDSQSEISVYRPSEGMWYIQGMPAQQWGTRGDVPVSGDYDGDGQTDIAVWRPFGGYWYILGNPAVQWGDFGDIPVPHDYNGGGTDIAVWRPSDGVWYINGAEHIQWGRAGDYPVPGNYDSDIDAEVAVWRAGEGVWYIYDTGAFQWGKAGDVPIPADYNDDGKTDLAVWRPEDGMWHIQLTGGGTISLQWGAPGDIPVPGDYNGDGITDLAVWRKSNGIWYVYGIGTYGYGWRGDIPLVK